MTNKFQVSKATPVVPSDTADIVQADYGSIRFQPCLLYVGTGGDLVVTTLGGDLAIFANVPSGTFLPVYVKKVMVATTADDILALW